MELWIRDLTRSKLVKPNYIYYVVSDDHATIYGETSDSSRMLGVYKSEERALEILDDIQKLIRPEIIVKPGKLFAETLDGTVYRQPDEVKVIESTTMLYEMPKE